MIKNISLKSLLLRLNSFAKLRTDKGDRKEEARGYSLKAMEERGEKEKARLSYSAHE